MRANRATAQAIFRSSQTTASAVTIFPSTPSHEASRNNLLTLHGYVPKKSLRRSAETAPALVAIQTAVCSTIAAPNVVPHAHRHASSLRISRSSVLLERSRSEPKIGGIPGLLQRIFRSPLPRRQSARASRRRVIPCPLLHLINTPGGSIVVGCFRPRLPPDHEFATHRLGGRLRLIHIRESRSFLILR